MRILITGGTGLIGRAMGRPSFVPIPGFAMKLAFGEVTSVLVEG